ncbi:MAG: M15 family metallopeptidase [Clostridia bacterium]|nr:M15 family metallopeptidase [Clostridia bacterium]
MTSKRRKAIRKRRIFISVVACVLVAAIVGVYFATDAIIDAFKKNSKSDDKNSKTTSSSVSKNDSENNDNTNSENQNKDIYNPEEEQLVDVAGVELDANFRRVLLVNGDNPLPDDYDSNIRKDLVTIDAKYRNNNYVTDIHKDVYPYITAMVAAANKDGVQLKVWSPFRSYAIQNDLFQKQVNRVGGDEELAATVVARPGTSEHNTGLCADFNMASDSFEQTKMYEWMMENAEDYGFILRYPENKIDVTGVIYESWHWRFVGINTAKEINELGVTLEEYIELKQIDWKSELA